MALIGGRLKRFSEWCYKMAGLPVIAASVTAFVLFIALVLPKMAGRLSSITGVDNSPDTSFIYSSADLYAMAESYGVEGRVYYIYQRFTFDLIWPLVYLLFIAALIILLFRHLPIGNSLRLMNLLPFAAVFFDLLENSGAAIVMYRYPSPTPVLASLVPLFTLFKWFFIAISFLAIVIGLLSLILNRMSRYKKNK